MTCSLQQTGNAVAVESKEWSIMAIKVIKHSAEEMVNMDLSDDRKKWYDRKNPRSQGIRKTFVITIDGEGDTNKVTDKHYYTSLSAANSEGNFYRQIERRINDEQGLPVEGLSTEKCFWFLLNLPEDAIKIGFSINYDINKMLTDVKPRYLQFLHEKQFVHWKGWTICWIQHKSLSLSRNVEGNKKTVTVWDAFSYFQTSFVKTIQAWNVGTREEQAFITDMKEDRPDFVDVDPKLITKYNKLECVLCSQLFDRVLDYTKQVGLKLRRYDGAGSVAQAMFNKHSVKQFMHQGINRLPDEVILSGYQGGRFDLTAYGHCGNLVEHDINSAYPYQSLSLPCLAHGRWRYTRTYDANHRWAIWNVQFEITKENLWSPFPIRDKHGVQYMRNGCGWYWQNEVREAIALYPGGISVREGYIFESDCEDVPFDFVERYFNVRQQLKAEGNLAEMILKLGLNSLYGKLAQNQGRFGTVPQTQCYIWAGIITSNTRAMLLTSIRSNPDDAFLVATDAVFRRSQSDTLDIGDGLGQWKCKSMPNMFIVSNGFYQAKQRSTVDGHWIKQAKTRGISPSIMYDKATHTDHWDKLRECARGSERFNYTVKRTDFFPLGAALANDAAHFNKWGDWITRDHVLRYGKFDDKEFRDGRLYPAENPEPLTMSLPFEPEQYRFDENVLVVTTADT